MLHIYNEGQHYNSGCNLVTTLLKCKSVYWSYLVITIRSVTTVHGCNTSAIHAWIAARYCHLSGSIKWCFRGGGLFAPISLHLEVPGWWATLVRIRDYLPIAWWVRDFHPGLPGLGGRGDWTQASIRWVSKSRHMAGWSANGRVDI